MKRLASTALVVVLLAAAAFAVVWLLQRTGEDGASPDPSSSSSDPPVADGVPARPADAFALTVQYVFDGDTIEARMQQPNDIVTTPNDIRIRIIGIDTPEGTPTPECWSTEARAQLVALLPEGSTVWAAPDRDTWDDYQRRLFNLWTDDGRFIAYEMVGSGSAEAIRVWPNVAYYDLLADTQADAEAAGAGQWGACG